MWILVLGMVGVFLASPFLNQGLYRDIYLRESKQIGVDNGAIILGRRLSRVVNRVTLANSALQQLELVHHPLHLCRNNSETCAALDAASEQKISTLVKATDVWVRSQWNLARAEALGEGGRMGALLHIAGLPDLPPLAGVRCPLCGLVGRFEWKPEALPLRISVSHALPKGELVTGLCIEREYEAFPRGLRATDCGKGRL